AAKWGPVARRRQKAQVAKGGTGSAAAPGNRAQATRNKRQQQAPGQAPRFTLTELSSQNGTPRIPFFVSFIRSSGHQVRVPKRKVEKLYRTFGLEDVYLEKVVLWI
ncbi:MAG TPA: hypothetical protein VKK79_09705, partial [Candidatus Lokiarchaeia archaeon]|nr:hypothetical protein [Candidatus Lokiarchaeia archaeon]